ncbi:transglutaminase-like domain-containing protein [Fluviispira multicolorata]|uniref:DUF3857 domain-containing protein n=1 Tax=Fluviispira multicolorata TaxID=2654512 RepID=A0A833JIA1_9BACT|nr:hypothetical protein [Fluviispira multicolorata]KAB8033797.1 hypothetical protein GCL57_03555 [Fluviispira multicolorata]
MSFKILLRFKVINLLIILSSLLLSEIAHARWQTKDDTTYNIDYLDQDIKINSDGTYTKILNVKITITKDSSINNILTQPYIYESKIETFGVKEAYTFFEGKKYIVSKDDIEDKSVASDSIGFQSRNQILIKYKNVKKGAELYLKAYKNSKKTVVPKLYSEEFFFNFSGYLLNAKIKVSSKIPFYVAKSDKDEILEIKETKSKSLQTLEIKLKKPFLKNISDEVYPYLNNLEVPIVMISTYDSWKKIADYKLKKYENILSQKLPESFEMIAVEAAKKETLDAKINTVTSLLADKIKYFGDWRTLESGFDPRDLSDIADSGLGDCKDYSISTTAILRKIGISAHMAAVFSGYKYQDPPLFLPNLFTFNHMIVRVDKDDQVKWIDPTQTLSYSQGIFPTIANRNALVFMPNTKGIERIPAMQSESFQFIKNETHDFSEEGKVLREGTLEAKGGAASYFTGLELQYSRDAIDSYLSNLLTPLNSNIISFNFGNYDFKSRIMSDKLIKYSIKMKSDEIKTDLGKGYKLNALDYFSNLYLINTIDRKSDLYIDNKEKFKSFTLLKNVYRMNKSFKGCKVKSRWADFSREIIDKKEGVEVIDEVETKQLHILNSEILSKSFIDFQDELDSCINGFAIINSSDKFSNS